VLHEIGAAGANIHFGRNQGSPVGTGNGEFNSPMGIAVDNGDNLYVVDHFNDRVQKFDSAGTFVTKWGTSGTGDGEFDGPVGIAVDNSDHVYVSDHYGSRIQKFSSAGVFITSWTATPLASTEVLSVTDATTGNDVGNYWGRKCGEGNDAGQLLFQPGVDSNALDLVDEHPFGHPVAALPAEIPLQARPCPE